MKPHTIALFEYDQCAINGVNESKLTTREVDLFQKLNSKIRSQNRFSRDIVTFEYAHGQPRLIRSCSYVGVMTIKNKSIQIIPKMAKTKDNHNTQAIKNVLHMLQYTRKLNFQSKNITSLRKIKDNFFEILIYFFSSELDKQLRSQISKDYILQHDNLPYLKGKLNFSDHIKSNVVEKQRFFLSYDEYSENNLLNQVFKYTSQMLLKVSSNAANEKLLRKLVFEFSDIDHRVITIEDLKRLSLNRLNQRFNHALELAKLFITHSSIEMSSNQFSTFSFIVDMNLLFEEYMAEFIKRELSQEISKMYIQGPKLNLVEQKTDMDMIDNKGVFQMRPDMHIEFTDGSKIIVDTKYKVLRDENDRKQGVSQADMYQMYAYSKKYNCSKLLLLYPQLTNQKKIDTSFKIDDTSTVHVNTVDVCRDLKTERYQLKSELKNILHNNI